MVAIRDKYYECLSCINDLEIRENDKPTKPVDSNLR